ncbi:30S ribosomal protein S16 [Candidatus Nomurabacteria bacterium]|nr:30S ribosomal protein S16 [Candidatus Nomurabacteria bacterium]
MLKIRLQRVGKKNQPTFRIVLTDSKNSTKSGKYLEILGNHDPINKKTTVEAEKVKYWMSKGAKLTDTLHNMFVNKKIISGKKINVLPKKKPIVKESKEGESKTEAKPADLSAQAGGAPAPEAKPAEAPKA